MFTLCTKASCANVSASLYRNWRLMSSSIDSGVGHARDAVSTLQMQVEVCASTCAHVHEQAYMYIWGQAHALVTIYYTCALLCTLTEVATSNQSYAAMPKKTNKQKTKKQTNTRTLLNLREAHAFFCTRKHTLATCMHTYFSMRWMSEQLTSFFCCTHTASTFGLHRVANAAGVRLLSRGLWSGRCVCVSSYICKLYLLFPIPSSLFPPQFVFFLLFSSLSLTILSHISNYYYHQKNACHKPFELAFFIVISPCYFSVLFLANFSAKWAFSIKNPQLFSHSLFARHKPFELAFSMLFSVLFLAFFSQSKI